MIRLGTSCPGTRSSSWNDSLRKGEPLFRDGIDEIQASPEARVSRIALVEQEFQACGGRYSLWFKPKVSRCGSMADMRHLCSDSPTHLGPNQCDLARKTTVNNTAKAPRL